VEQDLPSLRSRVFRAGSWTIVGHFCSLALRFVASLTLTRIFAPQVFGILSVLTAIQVIIALLTDFGVRQAVIQSSSGEDRSFLRTAWTIQILRGLLIWAVSILVAIALYATQTWNLLPAGSVYEASSFPIFVVASSFAAVILGFQSMKAITADRDLDVMRLTLIDVAAQIVSFFFIVGFGWVTRSIWSYIAGSILSSVLVVVFSHTLLEGPKDRLGWNRDAIRELARFGRWTFVSSAIGAAAMNGDTLLMGAWVPAPVLGFYSIAKNLASVADDIANRLYGRVSLPALSEVARLRPERFPDLLFRMRLISDSVVLGFAGFLFAAGGGIVSFLYDPRYSSAGWMLQWLSFGLVFTRYGVSQSAFLALARPQYISAINITKLVSILTIVPVAFYLFGVKGAVIGIGFHMFPCIAWIFYYNRRHGLNSVFVEVASLAAWFAGWLVGLGAVEILAFAKQAITGPF